MILGISYACALLYVRLATLFLLYTCGVRLVSGDALAAIWRAPPGGTPYFDNYAGYSGLLLAASKFVPTVEASFSEYTTSKYDRDI